MPDPRELPGFLRDTIESIIDPFLVRLNPPARSVPGLLADDCFHTPLPETLPRTGLVTLELGIQALEVLRLRMLEEIIRMELNFLDEVIVGIRRKGLAWGLRLVARLVADSAPGGRLIGKIITKTLRSFGLGDLVTASSRQEARFRQHAYNLRHEILMQQMGRDWKGLPTKGRSKTLAQALEEVAVEVAALAAVTQATDFLYATGLSAMAESLEAQAETMKQERQRKAKQRSFYRRIVSRDPPAEKDTRPPENPSVRFQIRKSYTP